MGRRTEPRIAVALPVTVRGFDPQGNPFTISAKTYDISFAGACLDGLGAFVAPGSKVEVETSGRRAWYRVRWVGKEGSSRAGRVGMRSLEHGRYIWGVTPKGWEPDMFEPSGLAQPNAASASVSSDLGSWAGPERRQFARHACRAEARVTLEDGSVSLDGKITDISLNGCYVEMLSPLPVETLVRLSFELNGVLLEPSGRIITSQVGTGMGIVFVSMNSQDFEALRRFAPPAAPPEIAAPPPTATSAETLDAVLHLLLRKGVITPGEVSEEIEKAKGRRVVIPV